jgi:putative hydrolase of the HAD superfamily
MRYLGIYEYFDKVCLSSDYHCKKPDEAYFKNLLDAEGLEPSKTMMIGNSEYDDIRTAKALGMGACYIHSNLSPEGEIADCDIVMRAMDLPSLEKILCR